MSAKRPAQQNIDQKTLEHQVNVQNTQTTQKQTNQQQAREQFFIVDICSIVTVKKQTDNNGSKPEQTKGDNKPVTTGGLFSGLFTNNQTTVNTPVNGSGLFANNSSSLFANNTGSGLFGSKPSTGLFANNGAASNQPKTGGLFSSTPSSSGTGSIFNFQAGGVPPIKNTGASLFGSAQHQNDDDDSGDSAQLEAAQNLEADPTKSTVSYKYQETCKLIIKQKAFKFKKIGGDLIQNVDIVITQDNQSQLYYITIQLPATKKSIYTGLLLPNKSQVKHLNNKKENVQISAFMIVNKKPQQAVLRCQVHDTVEQIVKGTYVYKQSSTQEKQQKKGEDEKKQTVVAAQTKQDN